MNNPLSHIKNAVPVRILPEDADWIMAMGEERNNNGKRLGWKSKTENQDNNWHIQGIAAEWAASMYYGLSISRITYHSKSDLNSGDLGDWIEVKSSHYKNDQFWNVAINFDQEFKNKTFIQCLTGWFPKWVFILGWMPGHYFDLYGDERKNNKTQHRITLVRSNHLLPPVTLFDEIRSRQAI